MTSKLKSPKLIKAWQESFCSLGPEEWLRARWAKMTSTRTSKRTTGGPGFEPREPDRSIRRHAGLKIRYSCWTKRSQGCWQMASWWELGISLDLTTWTWRLSSKLAPDPINKFKSRIWLYGGMWPIKSVMWPFLASLIGHFLHRVKFYTEMF